MWVVYVQFTDGSSGYFDRINGDSISYSEYPESAKKYPTEQAARIVEAKIKTAYKVDYVTSIEI